MKITSAQNPHIKAALKLRSKSAHRAKSGLFIFEGRREFQRSLLGGITPVQIFLCPELLDDPAGQTITQEAHQTQAEIFEIPPHLFDKLAIRQNTQGIIVISKSKITQLSDLQLPPNPLLLILDNIEKPGNLGAIFRIADSAGIHAILLTGPNSLNPWNPNAIRISLGTIFTVPFVSCSVSETQDFLTKNHIQLIATSPHASSLHSDTDLKTSTALIIGSEAHGLDSSWLDSPQTIPVKIPQLGAADSLNAAMAAAIITFEAIRQRNLK